MLGLIFSYLKSALVFSIMTALCSLLAIFSILFAPKDGTAFLRLIAALVVFLFSGIVSYILATRELESEIALLGGTQCNVGALAAKLNRLRHRCLAVFVRGPVRLEYALMLIYQGMYKDAEIVLSDTIALNISRNTAAFAHMLFAYLTFVEPDPDRFYHYYDSAVNWLNKSAAEKNTPNQAALVTARKLALDAMYAFVMKDDAQKALGILASAVNTPNLSNLLALTLRATAVEIARKKGLEPNAEYLTYLVENGSQSGYTDYYRYGANNAENVNSKL